jgi:hypothetical protein
MVSGHGTGSDSLYLEKLAERFLNSISQATACKNLLVIVIGEKVLFGA